MIQTTLEITFSDDNFAGVTVETNADGELKLQAELVGFAHLAATVISSLGRERARALVRSLGDGGFADDELRLDGSSGGMVRIAASFLDARRGPRLFFELKPRDLRRIGKDPDVLAARSVLEVLRALAGKRRSGRRDCRAGEGDRCPDRKSRRERVRATRDGIRRLVGSGRPCLGGCRARARRASLGFVGRPSLPGLRITRARVSALAEQPVRPAVLRELRSRSLVPRRPSAPVCSRCDVERIGEIARRPEGSLEERVERDCVLRRPVAGALLADLRTLFRENGWPFSDVRGAPVLFSELSGILGRWKFYAHVVEEQDLILLYSVCPFRVPEERRSEVSEFLTRANYGLAAGNFELDFADGEVRYKTALQRHVDGLDAATLKRAVRANGIAMETYLPGIGAVITGTAPAPALERHGGAA